jgi:hypothetical protein
MPMDNSVDPTRSVKRKVAATEGVDTSLAG